MMKILIVEDTISEQQEARKVFGDDVTIVSTLKDAVEAIDSGKYEAVLTDVYYPLGNIKKARSFQFLMGYVMESMEDLYNPHHNYRQRKDLVAFVESVKNGETEEVPSGMVLGIYALLKGVKPMWITNQEHHSFKTDALYWYKGQCGIEMLEETINGHKKWQEAKNRIDNLVIDFEKARKNYKVMESPLMIVVERIQRYIS